MITLDTFWLLCLSSLCQFVKLILMIRLRNKRFFYSLSVILVMGIAVYLLRNYRYSMAAIQIETEPEARVMINGQEVGKTPLDIERKAGSVRIQLIPEDTALLPYETTLSLTPQVKTIVRHKFSVNLLSQSTDQISFTRETPEIASLTIVTKPINSNILVDGKTQQPAPQKIVVAEGTHQIHLSSPDYEDKDITVQAVKGYNLTLYSELSFITDTAVTTPSNLGHFVLIAAPAGGIPFYKDGSFSSTEIGKLKNKDIVEGIARDEQNQFLKIITQDGKQGWVQQRYASPSASPTP